MFDPGSLLWAKLKPQITFEICESLGVISLYPEHTSSPKIGAGELWIKVDCLCVVDNSLIKPGLPRIDQPTIVVGLCPCRVKLNGLAVIFYGVVKFLGSVCDIAQCVLQLISKATIAVSVRFLRIQFYSLGKIGYRLIRLGELVVRNAPVEIGISKLRVKLNGSRIVADGSL